MHTKKIPVVLVSPLRSAKKSTIESTRLRQKTCFLYFSPVNTDVFLYGDLWATSHLEKNTFGRLLLGAACDFHLPASRTLPTEEAKRV